MHECISNTSPSSSHLSPQGFMAIEGDDEDKASRIASVMKNMKGERMQAHGHTLHT